MTISAPPDHVYGDESGGGEDSNGEPVGYDNTTQPTSEVQTRQRVDHADRRKQGDTFETLKSLVQDVLLERHGYVLNCALEEPPLCELELAGSPFSLLASANTHAPPPPSSAQTWNLLNTFQRFVGWQDANLVDVERLQVVARTLMDLLPELSLSSVSKAVTTHRLPLDSLALVFGALALGTVATGEFGHGQFYFDISIEIVKRFVGHSTLELCLALFLQHIFALRIGTLNYAQGIITQATQHAHALGLHDNAHGIQGLQLYLLIYMADQYCSLTHNTEPVIRTSRLQGQIFAPLSNAKPQLQTLIDLVTVNGYVIEHSHRLQSPSQNEVLELESKISSLCSRLIGPVPAQASCGGFRTAYEPLARVHMLCCRLKLRAPGLSEQASWLPSLCICVHAAEGVLSTYFQLYHPVLAALVKQVNTHETCTDKSSSPIAGKLATTWRQVKRIMMSTFVIVFAYWHGEMVHAEASRYVAMARLLLEYPRWRWGKKLDEAVQVVVDISHLSGFKLYDHTQKLLSGADEQYLVAATRGLTSDGPETYEEAFSTLDPSCGLFDAASMDGPFGSDASSFQNQTLFGLWETIECPVEGGS